MGDFVLYIKRNGAPACPTGWHDITVDDLVIRSRRCQIVHRENLVLLAGQRIYVPSAELVADRFLQKGLAAMDDVDCDCPVVFYDGRTRTLTVLRDRMGCMPLFYRHVADGLEVASREQFLSGSNTFSPAGIYNYLEFPVVSAPLAIVDGNRALLPGEALLYQQGNVRTQRWWELSVSTDEGVSGSLDELSEQFYSLFMEGLNNRTADLDRIDSFLSGGLDTGTIVASLARSGRNVRAHTLGFKAAGKTAEPYDEVDPAGKLARHLGIEHHYHRLEEGTVRNSLNDVIAAMGHPGGDTLNSYFALKALGLPPGSMLLAGTAGDEVLQGVDMWLKPFLRAERLRQSIAPFIPRRIQDITIEAPRKRDFSRGLGKGLARKILAVLSPYDRWKIYRLNRYGRSLDRLLTDDFLRLLADVDREEPYRVHFCHQDGLNPVRETMVYFLRREVAEGQCKDISFLSQSMGLDVRFPFLFHRLVSFVATLPPSFIFDEQRRLTKVILRHAARRNKLFFDEYLQSPKKGFVVPLDIWLRGELRELVTGVLTSKDLAIHEILKPSSIEELTRTFFTTQVQNFEVWKIVVLELWLRHYHLGPPWRWTDWNTN